MSLAKLARDYELWKRLADNVGIVPQEGTNWLGMTRLLQNKTPQEQQAIQERFGRAPHRVRQKMLALSRKMGDRVEVLGDLSNPSVANDKPQRSLAQAAHAHQQQLHTARQAMRDQFMPDALVDQLLPQDLLTGKNFKASPAYYVGDEHSVGMASKLHRIDPENAMLAKAEENPHRFVHTHPGNSRVLNEQSVRLAEQPVEQRTDFIRKKLVAKNPMLEPYAQAMAEMEAAQLPQKVKDLRRGSSSTEYVLPSGRFSEEPEGDMAWIAAHPEQAYPIMAPRLNLDSANQMRPGGLRSIIYKTEKGR